MQNQLSVASFAISSRSLSSQGASENIVKAIAESPQNVIDLTETSSQALAQTYANLAANPSVADVSITALGLGSNWTPIGWCLHYLEFLHSVFPWWGSIAIGTVILRVLMLPLVVRTQTAAAKMNALLPEQAILKEKINQARLVGDTMEFARLSQEQLTLFKRHGVSPLSTMLPLFGQVPVFLTFFLTLKRMADYPVESLKTGGFLWVTDLSIPDPVYGLPIFMSLTLWASMEISFRSGNGTTEFSI